MVLRDMRPFGGRGRIERLSIRLFGELELSDGSSPVVGDRMYAKVKALLAFLLMEPGPHARESLADLLWPEQTGDAARGNLRVALYRLSEVLKRVECDQSLLVIRRTSVAIRPDPVLWVDAWELERGAPEDAGAPELEGLAALYRGPFLDSLAFDHNPDFNAWVEQVRARMRRKAFSLLERLIRFYEAGGEHEQAVAHAERQLLLDPWNEKLHLRMIRLHGELGQLGEAERHYSEYRDALWREFGESPGRGVLELMAQLRSLESVPSTLDTERPEGRVIERRHATVLPTDITAASDPEWFADRLQEPRRRAREIIERFEGRCVVSHMGDVVGWFGFPQAVANAAERAVEAGLALVSELGGAELEVRVGIASGVILADGASKAADFGGLTSIRAALLQRVCGANAVIVDEAARRLVGRRFACEPQGGADEVQSKAGAAYRVTGVRPTARAFARSPVGRRRELARLRRAWQAVRRGETRAVLVTGDTGIGKSHLVTSFYELAAAEGGAAATLLHALPGDDRRPFRPLIDGLRAKDAGADAPGAGPSGLRRLLKELSAFESMPFDCIDGEGGRIVAEIADLLLPPGRPALLLVEDLQYADPGTMHFLQRLVGGGGRKGSLIVCTADSDTALDWWRGRHARRLPLCPLGRAEAEKLVSRISGSERLSRSALEVVLRRADGVPLFLEALTRWSLPADEKRLFPTRSLPPDVAALITKTLDRLGHAKAVVQTAAVLAVPDDSFSPSLLSRVMDDADVGAALQCAAKAGLIVPDPLANSHKFRFRHPLFREAAYQMLTRSHRRALHEKAIACLERHGSDLCQARPELLASHLCAVGETACAVSCWLEAARNASDKEDLDYLYRALSVVGRVEGPARYVYEAELCFALGMRTGAREQPIDTVERLIAVLRKVGGGDRLRLLREFRRRAAARGNQSLASRLAYEYAGAGGGNGVRSPRPSALAGLATESLGPGPFPGRM